MFIAFSESPWIHRKTQQLHILFRSHNICKYIKRAQYSRAHSHTLRRAHRQSHVLFYVVVIIAWPYQIFKLARVVVVADDVTVTLVWK